MIVLRCNQLRLLFDAEHANKLLSCAVTGLTNDNNYVHFIVCVTFD